MNRFTRYVAEKHGLKPHAHYPWIPYEVGPNVVLEAVEHRPETAQVVRYYLSITETITIGRDGEICNVEYD